MPVDLKKKYGPLSAVGWAASVGGVVLTWYVYKRYQADRAASAAASSTATPAGVDSTVPGSEAVNSTTGSSPVWSSLEQWEQAAISAMTGSVPGYTGTQAFNDLTDWINGSCVTQSGYQAIGQVINNPSVGLPPGFNAPALSVCADALPTPVVTSGLQTTSTTQTATTTTPTAPAPTAPTGPGNPPNLPAAIAAAMTTAGEVLGGAPVYDAAYNEWLFFTNKGGIYNIAPNGAVGAVFNGSYEGLPAADKGPGPTGSTNRTFSGLSVNPDGTYTLTDTLGENYTFTPSTPQVA